MSFEKPNYTYRVRDWEVIDGDTIDVVMDLGCHVTIHRRLRLLDLDTDEMRGGTEETKERARQATMRMAEFLSMGKVYVTTEMDATGKYGRLLARVYVDPEYVREVADPDANIIVIDVNKAMVEEGYQKGNTDPIQKLY